VERVKPVVEDVLLSSESGDLVADDLLVNFSKAEQGDEALLARCE